MRHGRFARASALGVAIVTTGGLAGLSLSVPDASAAPEQAAGARARPVVVDDPDRSSTRVVSSSSETRPDAAAPAPAALPVARFPRRVAVVLLVPQTFDQLYTVDAARRAIFDGDRSANQFYREEYGLAGPALTGDVYGWWEVPSSAYSDCDFDTWTRHARDAARAHGLDLSRYDHVIVGASALSPSCHWAGLGELGTGAGLGRFVVTQRALDLDGLAIHELGHNLGLLHAGGLYCFDDGGAQVSISATCSSSSYLDEDDVMGGRGTRHFHAGHKRVLGILPASNVQRVTTSGEYTIVASERPADPGAPEHVQMLEIPRPRGDTYQLEVRARDGVFDDFAPTDRAIRGVSVRLAVDPAVADDADTNVIDTTPGSRRAFADAPLVAGRSFVDTAAGIRVTTLAVGDGRARVRVELGGLPPPQSPPTRVGLVDGRLTITGDPLHPNDVEVAQDHTTFWVASWGGIGTVTGACAQVSELVARCGGIGRGERARTITVTLGDDQDWARLDVDKVRARIDGGAGADWLIGGGGSDVIDGGPGDDLVFGDLGRNRLLGGPGVDEIFSAARTSDVIDCGPDGGIAHADRRDRVTGCVIAAG